MALADFVANNAVNMAIGYSPFHLNHADHPLVPLVLMHSGDVLSHMEVVDTMVDRMKTTLEEAQTNLIIAQSSAKEHMDHSRHDEMYEVGDEVVLLNGIYT